MKCPKCQTEIPKEQINITTDVGQCLQCDTIFKISENLGTGIEDGFDIHSPVQGTWIRKEGDEVVIGASTRSGVAFFLVPFMIVWSGASLGGIYGSQVVQGKFDLIMSIFGIPFLLGSLFFWSLALMFIFGKVEISLDNIGGKIFTGIGALGNTKKITWNEITTIKEEGSKLSSSGGALVLEGKKRISFGLGLNESRKYYLFRALKSILDKKMLH